MTAAQVLGVDPTSGAAELRERYRSLLLTTHPDRNDAPDAAEQTIRLTAAYRLLLSVSVSPPGPPQVDPGTTGASQHETSQSDAQQSDPSDTQQSGTQQSDTQRRSSAALVDPTTIEVLAPQVEAMLQLLEVAHRLGDVSYLDRSSGLLELVVEFLDAPTSSVMLTLTGTDSGTLVRCDVEPLSGGEAPSAAAVTQLLLRTLWGEDPTT